jgi:hypothetical protein
VGFSLQCVMGRFVPADLLRFNQLRVSGNSSCCNIVNGLKTLSPAGSYTKDSFLLIRALPSLWPSKI